MKSKDPIRIFAISGSTEYHSRENLERLKAFLEARGDYELTISEAGEHGKTIPDLDVLKNHDVLFVFCKRLELPPEALMVLMKWCWTGKPVVGIRTASHAFQTWLEFDAEILGGSYSGHGPSVPQLDREVVGSAKGHPVLDGVEEWSGEGKVYRNPELARECVALMQMSTPEGKQPVAWARTHPQSRGRIFYTSLGEAADFEQDNFLGLLKNAIDWTACRTGAYAIRRLGEMDTVKCPCGNTRRAFATPDNPLATVHMVDITEDSQSHYHRRLTEVYLIVEGSGYMEVNGERISVGPLDTLLIERGCRHRAVGDLRIVNIPIPAFDPADEWF